jgi:tetratricopeptide (TPR) repeat protein
MREYLKEVDAPKTLAALCVLLVAIAVYHNALAGGFVNWDDRALVMENRSIRGLKLENVKAIFSGRVGRAYLPVRDLSYMIDYHFWMLTPLGFHLTSILLHAGTCVFLFLLLHQTFGTIRLALFTSLLFATHPVGTESVAWVSGRKEVLAAFFIVLGLYLYVKSAAVGPERFWQYYLAALVCFLAACFSKATAVVFPGLAILLDFAFRPGAWKVRWRQKILAYSPFFLVAMAAAVVHIIFGLSRGTVKVFHGGNLLSHIFLSARAFVHYLRLMIFPTGLRPFYDVADFLRTDPRWLRGGFSLALSAVFVIVVFVCLKRWRKVAFGLGWFLLALLPVSGVIPTSTLLAERYLYIPSIGFLFIPALILTKISSAGSTREERAQSTTLGIGLLAAILGLYAWGTVRRNPVWRDSVSLWSDALRKSPLSVDVRLNLADAYYKRGEKERPLQILEEAGRIMPRVAEVHLAKGRIYFDQERLGEAENSARQAVDNPASSPLTHAKAYSLWGDVLKEKRNAPEAIQKYQKAIETFPQYILAYNKLGATYEALGQFTLALEVYKKAVAREPTSPAVHYNLGNVYQSLNDLAKAETEYKKAILLGPEPDAYGRSLQAQAHTNLANIYFNQKRFEKALGQLLLAVDLDPSLIPPRLLLGATYMELKYPERAKIEFEAVLKMDPDNQYAKEFLEAVEQALSEAKSETQKTPNP